MRRLSTLLDLEPNTRLVLTEPNTFEPVHPDLKRSQAVAMDGHTPYLQAILSVRAAELQSVVAENNARWDLGLNASARFSESRTERGQSLDALADNLDMGNYVVGLSLKVPLGDRESRARKRQQMSSRLSLERARYRLAAIVREMEVAVRDAVRAVESGNRGVVHAQDARELAEKKLTIEREKLRLGLSSTFQITTYEADLVNAQVNELRATIRHKNAVTDLDRLLGTTLSTWQIDLE